MQSANIDSAGKIIGLMNFNSPHFPTVPDEAQIGDYLIDGILYPSQGKYRRLDIVDKQPVWTDDRAAIASDRITEIDAQITALETAQTRQLREIALGMDSTGTARDKLAASDVQIATLREQRAEYEAQISA